MAFLKIAGKNITIKTMDNMMDFFNSMTGNSYNPKTFNIEAINGERFKLQISSIQKEDGSGKKFLFSGSGVIEDGNSKNYWKPINEKIEGFVNF